jgi:hypothetical protein
MGTPAVRWRRNGDTNGPGFADPEVTGSADDERRFGSGRTEGPGSADALLSAEGSGARSAALLDGAETMGSPVVLARGLEQAARLSATPNDKPRETNASGLRNCIWPRSSVK